MILRFNLNRSESTPAWRVCQVVSKCDREQFRTHDPVGRTLTRRATEGLYEATDAFPAFAGPEEMFDRPLGVVVPIMPSSA